MLGRKDEVKMMASSMIFLVPFLSSTSVGRLGVAKQVLGDLGEDWQRLWVLLGNLGQCLGEEVGRVDHVALVLVLGGGLVEDLLVRAGLELVFLLDDLHRSVLEHMPMRVGTDRSRYDLTSPTELVKMYLPSPTSAAPSSSSKSSSWSSGTDGRRMRVSPGMADTRAREGESMTDAPLAASKCMAAPFAEPFAEAAGSTADGRRGILNNRELGHDSRSARKDECLEGKKRSQSSFWTRGSTMFPRSVVRPFRSAGARPVGGGKGWPLPRAKRRGEGMDII